MLNLGHNWGNVHWPDNWTATTIDGKRSAQFEDTLLYVSHAIKPHSERKELIDYQHHGNGR